MYYFVPLEVIELHLILDTKNGIINQRWKILPSPHKASILSGELTQLSKYFIQSDVELIITIAPDP